MFKFRTAYCDDDYCDDEFNYEESCCDPLEYVPLERLIMGYSNGDRSNIRTDFTYDGEDDVKSLNDDIFDIPMVDDRGFDPADIPSVSTLRDISESLSSDTDSQVKSGVNEAQDDAEPVAEEKDKAIPKE